MAVSGRALAWLGCVLGATTNLVCALPVRLVPRTQHPLTGGPSPVAVDTAPPPAEVEAVSPAPAPDCAWLDGQWNWVEHGWEWAPGGWVQLEPGCAYAPPLAVWVPSVEGGGVLFYTHGQWYRENSGAACPPPSPCIGKP